MLMKRIVSVLILFFFLGSLFSQVDTISIMNGSFEGLPRAGSPVSPSIKSWYDCGAVQFPNESAPDIHPKDFWSVNLAASDGKTYLGMVVRDNDSWESVSQSLTKPIKSGSCYSFSVNLARSKEYLSGSRRLRGNVEVQYTQAIVLMLWGSDEYCGKRELIAQSVPIENQDWQVYQFEFKASNNQTFITLEAYYEPQTEVSYNGHILIDNLSHFIEIPCSEDD